MDQLFLGIIASLVAATIFALAGVATGPALQAIRRIRQCPRQLEAERMRVAQLEETLRTIRSLLLALDIAGLKCDLARVQRDVKTRLQWSKEEPRIIDVALATRTVRLDRGALGDVVEGMKVRIWSRSGGPAEDYVFQPHDIDQRCAYIRLRNSDLLARSTTELGASFVTPAPLTALEETMARLLTLIDSSVPN
jgi:hypothetical protein